MFYNDAGRGPTAEEAREVDVQAARDAWADLRGKRGNFFGLIDGLDRTFQLYFDESIPNGVDDASHLEIVSVDFPVAAKRGSFQRKVSIGEASELIAKAFEVGADPDQFAPLEFVSW
jgi:hypothetical protein